MEINVSPSVFNLLMLSGSPFPARIGLNYSSNASIESNDSKYQRIQMHKTTESSKPIMIAMNLFLIFFLAVYLFQTFFDLGLEKLNLKYLAQRRNQVPPSFDGFIDAARLSKINAYTFLRSRLSTDRSLTSDLLLLVVLLSGAMPALAWLLTEQSVPFMLSGLLFFLVPGMVLYIFDLPFDYYHTFALEEKFGFNQSTLKIWLLDHVKSGLLSLILSSLVLILILWTIKSSPRYWWVWGFLLVSLVQIIIAVLYPIAIAPLFNKFTPLEDELLAEKITRLMEENGIRVKKVLQMNATFRSRHTNAYFTGLGKTKQIVLFDSLIESHPHNEVLAVLAHEAGHYKKRHILKQLLLFAGSMLIGFFITYQLMRWPLLYSTFGFETQEPYIGLFFIAILWQKAGYFLKPFYMNISRRFERQADSCAVQMMKNPQWLATALKRMAADNLSNLSPHPLYVKFNYSHPPLFERVAALEASADASRAV